MNDLAAGMPIVRHNEATPTPNFEPRTRDSKTTYEQWEAGMPDRDFAVIERVRKAAQSEYAAE